jgi:FMN phosphatase YigB (HAD superfamily)
MLEAILTDLDGTLLDVDMNVFIPRYLKLMQKEAVEQGIIAPEHDLGQDVLTCTARMLADVSGDTTNQDVFMGHFFLLPAYQGKEEQMTKFFAHFYDQVFPAMKDYTACIPQAAELVAKLSALGKPLILATNPLFPEQAIRWRVEWAGLDPRQFLLMTAYEQMHAAKPHLQYYQEICRLYGFDPARCLMIGNDAYEDVVAGQLGMRTYLLTDHLIPTDQPLQPTWSGSMTEFMDSVLPGLE